MCNFQRLHTCNIRFWLSHNHHTHHIQRLRSGWFYRLRKQKTINAKRKTRYVERFFNVVEDFHFSLWLSVTLFCWAMTNISAIYWQQQSWGYLFCVFGFRYQFCLPGACFSKVTRTFQAQKAGCQTAIRFFWKANLLTSLGNCGIRNRPEKVRDFGKQSLGQGDIYCNWPTSNCWRESNYFQPWKPLSNWTDTILLDSN